MTLSAWKPDRIGFFSCMFSLPRSYWAMIVYVLQYRYFFLVTPAPKTVSQSFFIEIGIQPFSVQMSKIFPNPVLVQHEIEPCRI